MKLFLLFAMLFCHIVDDFYLQGILAKLKQKEWWQKNAPYKLYENDYKVALIVHAISWSFMIMLPLVVYMWFTRVERTTFWYVGLPMYMIGNTIWHAWTDNQKANKHEINLIVDQTVHLIQIIITYVGYLIAYC